MTGMERIVGMLVKDVPHGWTGIGPVSHPADGSAGVLARCDRTGAYGLWSGLSMRSVPQRWAAKTAKEMEAK